MVAKASDPEAIAALADYNVVVLCETAAGILAAPALAQLPNVVALMWGAEDLVASLGGTSSRFTSGPQAREPTGPWQPMRARSCCWRPGAFGKVAIDSIYADFADLDGLAAESEDAVASGFGAKACIHPSQVAVIRAAYRPGDAEVAAAQELLAAAEAAGTGVFAFKGTDGGRPHPAARQGRPCAAPASNPHRRIRNALAAVVNNSGTLSQQWSLNAERSRTGCESVREKCQPLLRERW